MLERFLHSSGKEHAPVLRRILLIILSVGVLVAVYYLLRPTTTSLMTVEGRVVIPEKPNALSTCSYGRIWLYNEGSDPSHPVALSVGDIGRDGKFRIYTDGRPGAPAGRYRVVVQAVEQRGVVGARKATQVMLVAKKYTDSATTPLFIEVPLADHGEFCLYLP